MQNNLRQHKNQLLYILCFNLLKKIMAKPTKYAPHICTTVTIVALVGLVLGLIFSNALIAVIFLLPATIYEVYRTEGKSTKISSTLLLVILVAEILLIIFNVNFNLAEFLQTDQEYVGGYLVPLGNIRVVGPTMMAVLSIVLFTRTRGKYTKWLAVTIFVASFGIVYLIDPNIFSDLLKLATKEGLNRI